MAEQQTGIKTLTKKKTTTAKEKVSGEDRQVVTQSEKPAPKPVSKPKPKFKERQPYNWLIKRVGPNKIKASTATTKEFFEGTLDEFNERFE